MAWVGGLIVMAAFAAIIKGYEMRMVFFLAGLVMAAAAIDPGAAFDAFGAMMVSGDFVPVICSVAGFAFVMKQTGCEEHYVRALAGGACRLRPVIIPCAVGITFAINIVVPTAAGCAAMAGILLLPLLLRAGVDAATAAAAVLAGTWGSVLNPGLIHNPFIARLAGINEAAVISGHLAAVCAGFIVVAGALTLIDRRRQKASAADGAREQGGEEIIKIDFLKAAVPVMPLAIVVVGSPLFGLAPWDVTVPAAMIIGVILAFGATLYDPEDMSRQFFAGIGEAYGGIIGFIAAAAVFTKGMEVIGVTGGLINLLRNSEHFVSLAVGFGPLLLAVITGSGDSATLALNTVVTPFAGQFGYKVSGMGSLAFISGSLGRAMSPLAAATLVCAALAKVSPVVVAGRNFWGVLAAAVLITLIML